MWVDNETDQDLLGFRIHADLIRSIITDKSLLPTTIGVFGDWGGGKTSIMKMLQRDLEPDIYPEGSPENDQYNKLACLYFNGWLFEGYDDAKSALLNSILTQLSKHKRFGPKVKEKVGALLSSIDLMRVLKFSLTNIALPAASIALTGGIGILPAILGVGKELFTAKVSEGREEEASTLTVPEGLSGIIKDSTNKNVAETISSFRDSFAELLKESDIEYLIVLIDDLDRCSPERIIENLEAIKLFLNVPGSAFVIGADPRIVRHAVATVFPPLQLEESTAYSSRSDIINDYLEKVIQVPYTLPRLSPAEVESYMSLLFCQKLMAKEEFVKVIDGANSFRDENRYSVFSKGAIGSIQGIDINEDLDRSLTFCNQGAPLITEGLKGNPRQIKRFLNAYWLRTRLAEVAKLSEMKDGILVKLMILEYSKPRQFEQLFNWQASQSGCPAEIVKMESIIRDDLYNAKKEIEKINSEWNNDYIIRWLQIEPKLSNIDLRDYFWIARDKLRTTLSGISMVPPIIRKTFEELISDETANHTKAIELIESFDEVELSHLYGLFENKIRTEPEELNAFKAMEFLCRKKVPQSTNVLAELLSKTPAEKIDPTFGLLLLQLLESNPDIDDSLTTVVESLRGTETRIGAALTPRKKVGK